MRMREIYIFLNSDYSFTFMIMHRLKRGDTFYRNNLNGFSRF